MAGWAGIQGLIFDLDGTLYDSPELLASYPRVALEMIAERLGISREEAVRRYEEEYEALWRASGIKPSSTRILVTLTGASLDEWAGYLNARVDPADYLDPRDYPWLPGLLKRLHRYYRLGIVSNNNRLLAGRILSQLGVMDCFDAILTTTESGRIKPDPTLYLDMAALLGVPPAACLSIGDREWVDITPAEEVGVRGYLVSGPADLRPLAEELLAAKGE